MKINLMAVTKPPSIHLLTFGKTRSIAFLVMKDQDFSYLFKLCSFQISVVLKSVVSICPISTSPTLSGGVFAGEDEQRDSLLALPWLPPTRDTYMPSAMQVCHQHY